jgi:TRAP-type mannitol/chloroaromatic compound transport system permease large subunit
VCRGNAPRGLTERHVTYQTSIRILDILFCEGYDSTFMFKVALAVFKFNQKFILNTKDFSKLVIQLKFTNLDCDTLLEVPYLPFICRALARGGLPDNN